MPPETGKNGPFKSFQSLESFPGVFPIIGNFSRRFSNHWKLFRAFFQSLETFSPDFPIVGKLVFSPGSDPGPRILNPAASLRGFTFIEMLIALVVSMLIVMAVASVLLTSLRLERAGDRDMRDSLAMHRILTRHHLALPDVTPEPPSAGSGGENETWAIYALTAPAESDSLPATLTLKRKNP